MYIQCCFHNLQINKKKWEIHTGDNYEENSAVNLRRDKSKLRARFPYRKFTEKCPVQSIQSNLKSLILIYLLKGGELNIRIIHLLLCEGSLQLYLITEISGGPLEDPLIDHL